MPLVQHRQRVVLGVAALEELRVLLVLEGLRQLRHALLQIIVQLDGVHMPGLAHIGGARQPFHQCLGEQPVLERVALQRLLIPARRRISEDVGVVSRVAEPLVVGAGRMAGVDEQSRRPLARSMASSMAYQGTTEAG